MLLQRGNNIQESILGLLFWERYRFRIILNDALLEFSCYLQLVLHKRLNK
jgi:hypothetical protein